MRTIVVGAGPTGLFTAIVLARRGRSVVVVDREPGPPSSNTVWDRRGVMQFHHAHTFRAPVVEALRAEMPDALDDLVAKGATIATAGNRPVALLCRRTTLEHALWNRAAAEPGVRLLRGHVDRIEHDGRRAVGITVDGRFLPADLVIDASGRSSRFTDGFRPHPEGGDCGAVYVTRQYRLLDRTDIGPMNSPIGLSLGFSDYIAIAFVHDDGAFSITFTHDGTDKRLRLLRRDDAFDDAVRAIPLLTQWIDPARAQPVSRALPGGRLYNTYRGQLDAAGRPALPGLISVGDAVCTTTPLAGRGVTLALMQAQELVRILDAGDTDIDTATTQFDHWCRTHIRPWFDDHRYTDADRMRRWAGGDVDLGRRLPSDLIVAAADADPALKDVVGPYSTMDAMPASLAPAHARAKEIYAAGWRPPVPDGPTRDDLSEVVSRTPAAA
ncbi:Lycopene cyclase protein [Mycobacterium sp. JS623]|uniref:FAD-dependent oxidoreductase n=1 Tax=Mycobacterium sp. JS623 TaxID=212767 RepID=UPI0002A5AC40|nr:FAD-dependent oxidoreductase [Mycobacterium sp. JS623]AGB23664.1 Lycopene cyclase protein [Mycobacterium sp. JS623]